MHSWFITDDRLLILMIDVYPPRLMLHITSDDWLYVNFLDLDLIIIDNNISLTFW